MNRGVWIGGGVGLLVLAGLGSYWLVVSSSPAPDRPAPVTAAAPGGPRVPMPSAAEAARQLEEADRAASIASSPGAGPDAGAARPWVVPPVAGLAATSGASSSASASGAAKLSPEERRLRREQVRAKLAELRAKGPKATIEETRQVMDEVERLGAGILDPRYFQAVREMLGHAVRAEALSQEFRRVAQSQRPEDVARQQAILAELRDISQRLAATSTLVQAHATTAMGGKR
ncbi:MAG: hypothetical protein ACLGG8_10625 [Gammaproteobacteria bacterium]